MYTVYFFCKASSDALYKSFWITLFTLRSTDPWVCKNRQEIFNIKIDSAVFKNRNWGTSSQNIEITFWKEGKISVILPYL